MDLGDGEPGGQSRQRPRRERARAPQGHAGRGDQQPEERSQPQRTHFRQGGQLEVVRPRPHEEVRIDTVVIGSEDERVVRESDAVERMIADDVQGARPDEETVRVR